MATTNPTQVRTEADELDTRGLLLLAGYAGGIVLTIALATGAAAVAASFTAGLGQFLLVAGGWLAVVSASPDIAKRGTMRLAEIEFGQRAPRTSRAVTAAVTYVLAR